MKFTGFFTGKVGKDQKLKSCQNKKARSKYYKSQRNSDDNNGGPDHSYLFVPLGNKDRRNISLNVLGGEEYNKLPPSPINTMEHLVLKPRQVKSIGME